MNKIIIIGHLGRDPEMRYGTSGTAMTSFSVASSRKYTTNSGEQRDETEWFNCTAFGKLADACQQYLSKGRQVYVEGRLTSREYSRQDGTAGFSLDVNVQEVQFLGNREERGAANWEEQRGRYDRPANGSTPQTPANAGRGAGRPAYDAEDDEPPF